MLESSTSSHDLDFGLAVREFGARRPDLIGYDHSGAPRPGATGLVLARQKELTELFRLLRFEKIPKFCGEGPGCPKQARGARPYSRMGVFFGRDLPPSHHPGFRRGRVGPPVQSPRGG